MKKIILLLLTILSLPVFAQFPARNDQTEEALAFQYYQQGEYDKAAALFEKLFTASKSEGHFDFYFNSLLKLKNYPEAEKLVRRMIKLQQSNPVYTVALGRIYLETGKKAQAEKTFESAISSIPADEFRVRMLANAFYRMESYDIAAKVFEQGRKFLNNDKLFTFDLISIYRFKKDKEKLVQEYITALGYMPEIIFQAQNAMGSLFESDADYEVLKGILLKRIQKEPDKEIYTDMLVWQFLQQKDYEMALRQLIAQDKRTKSNGAQLFNNAGAFTANQAYPTAVKAYEYLLTKPKDNEFYLSSRLELVNIKYQLATTGKLEPAAIADVAAQYASILDEYGRNIKTLFALRRWANLQAYYLKDPKKAELALEEAVNLMKIPGQEVALIKLDLGDLYVLTGQPWEAVLVYEQVAKQYENTLTGNEANYKSARLSFYQGNFAYAKSQADVLKASTTQLIANDALNLSLLISDNLQTPNDSLALKMFADAEMLQFRNLTDAALTKLDSIPVAYPGNNLEDDVLMAKSRIFVNAGDITRAAASLDKLVAGFKESLWIDDAIFTLAELNETRIKDLDKAKALYQRLITEHPGSMFTAEARKRFRNLRGDFVSPAEISQ